MADIVREVYKRLAATPGHPLYLEHRDATRAISAVLDLHSPTSDGPFSLVSWTYCSCGAQETHRDADGGMSIGPAAFPCPTMRALAAALGAREDGD